MQAILAGQVQPIMCPRLVDELTGVLARSKFRRYVTLSEAGAYVALVARKAAHHPDPVSIPARSRDRDDDYLLALAEQTHAEAIVSGDEDLLTMATSPPVLSPRHFAEALLGRSNS